MISGSRISFDAGATWQTATATGRTWVGAGLWVRADASATTRTMTVTPLAPALADARTRSFPAGVTGATLTGFAVADAETWFMLDADGVLWRTTTAGR